MKIIELDRNNSNYSIDHTVYAVYPGQQMYVMFLYQTFVNVSLFVTQIMETCF